MLNTKEISKIRNFSTMGFSFTEVCKLTGRDPKTVRKYLPMEDFSPKKPDSIKKRLTRANHQNLILDKIP